MVALGSQEDNTWQEKMLVIALFIQFYSCLDRTDYLQNACESEFIGSSLIFFREDINEDFLVELVGRS